MPFFDQWDIKKFTATPIELTKANVVSHRGVTARIAKGAPNPKTFRPMSKVKLTHGTVVLVDCPDGELQDRLNDATAEAPDPSVFSGIEGASANDGEN